MQRLRSIDFVRGLVMIIMALDHVRDLMHVTSITQSPTNLSTTSAPLFFTRWITYFCAPIFVFLAGTSAYISVINKNNRKQSRHHLIKRGLWLMLLEFTVVNLALFFDPGFHILIFEVIASTGAGFIVLGLLLQLSPVKIGFVGLVIICFHNLVPPLPLSDIGWLTRTVSFFFNPGSFPINGTRVFVMAYPPVSWLGIMLAGFAAGKFFRIPGEKRKALLLKTGVAALLLFLLIRFINAYGEPAPWSTQKSNLYSILSFLNISKYPPSLMFCLLTLGTMFLLLAFADKLHNRVSDFVTVYGKVPLFYFVVHFYLIHALTVVMLLCQGFSWPQLEFVSGSFGRPKGVTSGLPLGPIYLIWIAVVLLLYKPCQWFGKYKATHDNWWTRYL